MTSCRATRFAILLPLVSCLLATAAAAQGQSVRQSGTITPGHVATWVTTGVVKDGGLLAVGPPNGVPIYLTKGSTGLVAQTNTYAPADGGKVFGRFNNGGVMADLLPGSTLGVLPANTTIGIINIDATALLAIYVNNDGVPLNGSLTGYVVLGPSQAVTIYSDGANYYAINGPTRTKLAAATTLYVATNGLDSNPGVAPGQPFATFQGAVDTVYQKYDLGEKPFTIQFANGTYNQCLSIRGRATGQAGGTVVVPASFQLQGNVSSPSSVAMNCAATTCISAVANASFHVDGFKLTCGGDGISADLGSALGVEHVEYGAVAGAHLKASGAGSIHFDNDYAITGAAARHKHAITGGYIYAIANVTATLSGTLNFVSFAAADTDGIIDDGATIYTGGTLTGTRWATIRNGLIMAGNRALDSVYPGDVAGFATLNYRSVVYLGNNFVGLAQGATGYYGAGTICSSVTETACQTPITRAGTVKNMFVVCNQAPGAAQTYTFSMRKNLADASVPLTTCAISGASTTKCNDVTNAFTVAVSDTIDAKGVSSAGATTAAFCTVGIELEYLSN